MQSISSKSVFTLLAAYICFCLFDCAFISSAEAGVLFRNRRQVIRTTAPQFQQQNYRVDKSTVALRRTSGPISSRPIGTVEDQTRLIRTYYKYEQRVEKWENNKSRAAKKQREKQRKLAEKEQKRKAKEIARLRKKHEYEQRKKARQMELASQKQQGGSSATITSPASNPGSRGALSGTGTSASSQVSGKGFWRKLLDTLFGARK